MGTRGRKTKAQGVAGVSPFTDYSDRSETSPLRRTARKSVRANVKTPGVLIPAAWGLTRAEERTLEGLVAGLRPSEIAGAQRVSVHTVRTHLKRVMVKAGVHTQAALVARVYSVLTSR
jgi:DNA-binding CsgD family transcriptional regulator